MPKPRPKAQGPSTFFEIVYKKRDKIGKQKYFLELGFISLVHFQAAAFGSTLIRSSPQDLVCRKKRKWYLSFFVLGVYIYYIFLGFFQKPLAASGFVQRVYLNFLYFWLCMIWALYVSSSINCCLGLGSVWLLGKYSGKENKDAR